MSAVAIQHFLDDMLQSSLDGSSGAGSGVVNYLTGLDFSSVSGSPASSGGFFSGVGSLFGPGTGVAAGLISNIIPGLQGFLQNGFDFTCLGAQAYKKADLDRMLNELKATADRVTNGSLPMGQFLDHCCDMIHQSNLEIGRYASGCSKSLRTKYRDSAQQVYDSIDKSGFTMSPINKVDWKGGNYVSTVHTPKVGSQTSTGIPQNITLEQFETEYKPQIEAYALQNGLNVDEAIQTAYSNLFGGGTYSGGVVVNPDGSIDWNVSAGNPKPNNTLTYGLIAVIGFLIYKGFKGNK